MLERILIAGSGGQGILFAGKLLAQAALESVPFITFFPAYGAEVRGGTSHCQVILSSDEIGSPIAEQFDAMLVMNQQSADRFLAQLDEGGIAVVNQSLCRVRKDPRLVCVRATEIADKLGNPQSTNLVMLGALLAHKPLVSPRAVERQLAAVSSGRKQALLEVNLKAFASGLSASGKASCGKRSHQMASRQR